MDHFFPVPSAADVSHAPSEPPVVFLPCRICGCPAEMTADDERRVRCTTCGFEERDVAEWSPSGPP